MYFQMELEGYELGDYGMEEENFYESPAKSTTKKRVTFKRVIPPVCDLLILYFSCILLGPVHKLRKDVRGRGGL